MWAVGSLVGAIKTCCTRVRYHMQPTFMMTHAMPQFYGLLLELMKFQTQ